MAETEPETNWYQRSEFSRYWEHHHKMQEWYEKHIRPAQRQDIAQLQAYMEWCRSMHSYHKQHAEYMLQHWQYYSSLATPERNVGSSSSRPMNPTPSSARRGSIRSRHSSLSPANRRRQRRREKSRNKKRRRESRSSSRHVSCEVEVRVQSELEMYYDVDGDQETDTSHDKYEFEMEITEDMMQFFAHSAKHRKERDIQKKEETENEDDQYVDLAEAHGIHKKASKKPPTERPGAKRISEMKELYGEGSPMIHGMETSMQLTFDRNVDKKSPKLWPYLPLNIKFDQ